MNVLLPLGGGRGEADEEGLDGSEGREERSCSGFEVSDRAVPLMCRVGGFEPMDWVIVTVLAI